MKFVDFVAAMEEVRTNKVDPGTKAWVRLELELRFATYAALDSISFSLIERNKIEKERAKERRNNG